MRYHTSRRTRHTRIRRVTSSAVSSARLKAARQELAVVWDLAAAINGGSWRGSWGSDLGSGRGSRGGGTALEPGGAVSPGAAGPDLPPPGAAVLFQTGNAHRASR